MLDQLKELIPLMETVADGAFWLVIAYLSVIVFKLLLLVAAFLLIARWAISAVLKLNGIEAVKKNYWNMYQWDEADGSIDAMFTRGVFQELLKSIADSRGKVTSSEVFDAIAKLNK